MNRYWIRLFVAAVIEVLWVIGLAHANDFWTWTGTAITIIVSNYLMITAAQVLPAGTAYSVFVGLGTAGTVLSEILFFGEPVDWLKIFFILLIIIGVIGLKAVTEEKMPERNES